jgi:hypothetical protein
LRPRFAGTRRACARPRATAGARRLRTGSRREITVSFLCWMAGRSKGSSVASVMAAVPSCE